MTTITTADVQPTTLTDSNSSQTSQASQLWRLVATFVAGALLASGAAAGIAASRDRGPAPAPTTVTKIVRVQPSSGPLPECHTAVPSPC